MVRLNEVCKLVGGGTPSKANSDYYLGEIPWATVRDLRSRWLEETEHHINQTAVRASSTNIIPAGNVVLASRVGLGKVVQLKQETAINQDLRALIPKEYSKVDSNYLYYWALSIAPEIIAAGKGATVQGVTLPFLENLRIPLPSLEGQREIVEKLDRAFAEVDVLKNDVERELETVEILMKGLIDDQFHKLEGIAKESRLEDYCMKIQDGSHFSPKIQLSEPREGWFPYLTSKNIRNNYVDMRGITYIDSNFHEGIYQRCNPELGDLLLTKDGVNTGNITINSLDFPFSLLSSVCIIKVKKDLLDATYLKFYLQSSVGNKAILGDMTGAAIKRIILRTIKNLNIPIVALEKQQEIGEVLEACLMNIDDYRKSLNRKLPLIEDLRQSILSDAISQRESVS